jgi:hypothetical protein
MVATDSQRARLRGDLGAPDDESVFTNAEIDDYFLRASEEGYTGDVAVFRRARLIALDQLLASNSKLVNYQQNEASEDLSDVFKHLQALRKIYQADLDDAADGDKSAAKWGNTRRRPRRRERYPHG